MAGTATTKTPKKPKKVATHPSFADMALQAINSLADRRGSSKFAIKKYILSHFQVEDTSHTNSSVNLSLRKGVAGGKLITAKGHAGSYKVAKAEEPKPNPKAAARAASEKRIIAACDPSRDRKPKPKKTTVTKKDAKVKAKKKPTKPKMPRFVWAPSRKAADAIFAKIAREAKAEEKAQKIADQKAMKAEQKAKKAEQKAQKAQKTPKKK